MIREHYKGIIGLAVLLLAIGALFFVARQGVEVLQDPKGLVEGILSSADDPANPSDTKERAFSVRQGESAASIADRLQAAGLLKNGVAFRLMAEGKGVAGSLSAGDYQISPSAKPSEILAILTAGKIVQSALITIPEGWRAEQIADRVSARGVGTLEAFMALVREGKSDSVLLSSRPAGASLEGYLFPDSYRTDAKTTPESIEKRMVAQFEAKFTLEMKAEAAARGMSINQIVTLASIIEREAVVPSERPIMAGVFYNRLDDGMKLDTDPTVQYAVANADPVSRQKYGWWKTDLTLDDLAIDSPYNTYKYPGLPPGPICNPGLASLQAAVDPAPSDFLYFVAKPDGSHAFAKTLGEHNANVAKYRR